jgi:K+-transporting ATPase ATPase A chain
MFLGRFALGIPVLALAGQFALQPARRKSTGMIPGDTPMFAVVLTATIIIMGALSHLPSIALGPVVENILMHAGRLF